MTPRVLVFTIALIMLFCFLANAIESLVSYHFYYINTCLFGVRFALFLWLGKALVLGSRIARWIAVVLLAISGFYLLNKGTALVDPDSLWGTTYYFEGLLAIITGSFYSVCAFALLTHYAGRHFVKKVTDEQGNVTRTPSP